MLKRIGWVVLAGVFASLPGVLFSSHIEAPIWYVILGSLSQALGMGLLAIIAGTLVLVARRDHENHGLKPAVIVTIVFGAITLFAVMHVPS